MTYFLLALYILVMIMTIYVFGRNDDKRIRYISLGYFIGLTAAFVIGIIFFDITAGSRVWVSDEAYMVQNITAQIFSYLYVMPFILFVGYRVIKYIWNFKGWQRVVLIVTTVFNLIIAALLMILIFSLIFQNLSDF
ncbi:hypothetical protein [Salinicoccus albus]|uniref:hypothetical protein n=1 Tax=Salinicoccus albus TaxID=418756 RepID=UPI00036196A2|nr:hypothetical protein [Salinicoccus albus]